MKALVLIAALVALAACGIDGPPTAPGGAASGEVRIGVVGEL